jgi:hypothetical protein
MVRWLCEWWTRKETAFCFMALPRHFCGGAKNNYVKSVDRHMNPEPLKYEPVLATQQQHSVQEPSTWAVSFILQDSLFVPKCQNLPLSHSLPSRSMSSLVTSVGSFLPPGGMRHSALISLNRKLCQVLKLLSIWGNSSPHSILFHTEALPTLLL